MKYYSAICIADNEHLDCRFAIQRLRTRKELLEIGREQASTYGGSCLKVTEVKWKQSDDKFYDYIDMCLEDKDRRFVAWCKENGVEVPPAKNRLILTDENENILDKDEQVYLDLKKEKK